MACFVYGSHIMFGGGGMSCFVYSSHVLPLQGVEEYHVLCTVPMCLLYYRVWLDNSRATQPNIVEYVKEYLAHNITVSQQDTWLLVIADLGFELLSMVPMCFHYRV